jgi:HlyD family secretion protein
MQKILKFLWGKKRLLIVLLLIAGAIYYFFGRGTAESAQRTAVVQRGSVQEQLVLSGELRAIETANLAFGLSGPLKQVSVTSGQTVKKGQLIAALDTTELNSVYQQANAALRAAEATLARVYDSLKDKGASENFTEKETRVIAEATKDRAYESVVSSRKDLRDALLTSPFDGIVATLTNESAGTNVTAGTLQAIVVNPETIYFSVSADQTEVNRFKVGDKAVISLDAFEEPITGTVSKVSFVPSTAEAGTVYPIRLTLDVDNSSYQYKIGMSGDASFVLSEKNNVLWVPNRFVKTDPKGRYVLTGDGTNKVYVQVGIEGEDRVEISGEGISESMTVFD